jgi:hypothetical protein
MSYQETEVSVKGALDTDDVLVSAILTRESEKWNNISQVLLFRENAWSNGKSKCSHVYLTQ